MGQIYIGTSGWSYKGWNKTFYPPGLPVSRHFEHYAGQFRTVEINLTFYRLPPLAMVQGWERKAPPGFVYAVKGSRFITHMKKLTNLNSALDKFFERLQPLYDKTAVVLWQLPPMLRKDPDRLEAFLQSLPSRFRYAVEFRHASWLDQEVFAILRRHGAAQVSLSSQAMPMDLTVTADFIYIRFHGLAGGFAHDYTVRELEPWARHISTQASLGKTVFAYFNNDANVRAPSNAKALIAMTSPSLVTEGLRKAA